MTIQSPIDLIIYHGQCRDGWAASMVAHKKYPNAQLFEGLYGQPPPDVMGKHVLFVDFSYSRGVMDDLVVDAESLTVFDHHKTALKDLEGFHFQGAKLVFDMFRSGAGITWDELNPGRPRPWLIDYIEDRDLWNHKLPNTKEVNAFLSTIQLTDAVYDNLINTNVYDVVAQGTAVQSKTDQYIREVKRQVIRIEFQGYNVPIVNCSQVDISELLADIAVGEPLAIGWFQRADGKFSYSLRSDGKVDVSELAKRFGGGGHRAAAGFQYDKLLT